MLVTDPDMTEAEQKQFLMYQLKVWEKLFVQINRAYASGNFDKSEKGIDLIRKYGYALGKDWEYELERDLTLQAIFDEARAF